MVFYNLLGYFLAVQNERDLIGKRTRSFSDQSPIRPKNNEDFSLNELNFEKKNKLCNNFTKKLNTKQEILLQPTKNRLTGTLKRKNIEFYENSL